MNDSVYLLVRAQRMQFVLQEIILDQPEYFDSLNHANVLPFAPCESQIVDGDEVILAVHEIFA